MPRPLCDTELYLTLTRTKSEEEAARIQAHLPPYVTELIADIRAGTVIALGYCEVTGKSLNELETAGKRVLSNSATKAPPIL
jgi:hypothetical protein